MILSFDIGASKIRSAIVIKDKVKDKKVVNTPKSKEGIKKLLISLLLSYPKPDMICIGIASFIKKGVTRNTLNVNFSNVNVAEIFRNHFTGKIYVDNDANCAGLGELKYGYGKNRKNFILLTLGTGVGGAIIINNKLFRGTGYASEPGQMLINGRRLEDQVSGVACQKMAKKYGFANNKELKILADKGNKKSLKILNEIGTTLGIGLLNISYIFDPEIIILGGGFSNISQVIKRAQEVMKKEDIIKRDIKVVKAKLGEDAGLIGASLLHTA